MYTLYSEQNKKTYNFHEIIDMYEHYIKYCEKMGICPEYLEDEFYLFDENSFPSDFLNNLIYHKSLGIV